MYPSANEARLKKQLADLENQLSNINAQIATTGGTSGLSTLGLKGKLTEQQKWLDEKYGGYLSDIGKAGGIREKGLLEALGPYQQAMRNKLQLSFGGQPITSFVTRPDREVAESLFSKGLMLPDLQAGNIEKLGGMTWAGQEARPLYGADLAYLSALMGLSSEDLNRRFGLPTQTQTASLTGPGASLLTQLGSGINITGGLMKLYEDYLNLQKKQPSSGGGNVLMPPTSGYGWNI